MIFGKRSIKRGWHLSGSTQNPAWKVTTVLRIVVDGEKETLQQMHVSTLGKREWRDVERVSVDDVEGENAN